MKDQAIVRLFVARDENAIGQTQTKYGSRLKYLAYEITQDAETAEECENDVYLGAWNAIPPHEPYDYFYAFLTHLVRNAALNRCRCRHTQKRKATVEELTDELANTIPGGNDVDEFIDDTVLRELLNTFLGTLPEETRNVFVRRYWYMDSVERIAVGYGMSESKVKSMLFRCRNKLKHYLQKEGYNL